jgi:hypothetical protein
VEGCKLRHFGHGIQQKKIRRLSRGRQRRSINFFQKLPIPIWVSKKAELYADFKCVEIGLKNISLKVMDKNIRKKH